MTEAIRGPARRPLAGRASEALLAVPEDIAWGRSDVRSIRQNGKGLQIQLTVEDRTFTLHLRTDSDSVRVTDEQGAERPVHPDELKALHPRMYQYTLNQEPAQTDFEQRFVDMTDLAFRRVTAGMRAQPQVEPDAFTQD